MKEKYRNIAYLIIFLITMILGITLIFKCNVYKITFVVDNNIFETKEIRKNNSIKSVPKPEKEGYSFVGWYDNEGNLLLEKTILNENKIYYARWAKIVGEEEIKKLS